jgi:hypothetical protein
MWRWESGKYPPEFMSKVVAWYRLHNMVEQHVQDAVNKASSRKGKH